MKRFELETFERVMEQIEQEAPLLFQFIVDFVHKKVTHKEVINFCRWSADEQTAYLKKRYKGTV